MLEDIHLALPSCNIVALHCSLTSDKMANLNSEILVVPSIIVCVKFLAQHLQFVVVQMYTELLQDFPKFFLADESSSIPIELQKFLPQVIPPVVNLPKRKTQCHQKV